MDPERNRKRRESGEKAQVLMSNSPDSFIDLPGLKCSGNTRVVQLTLETVKAGEVGYQAKLCSTSAHKGRIVDGLQ